MIETEKPPILANPQNKSVEDKREELKVVKKIGRPKGSKNKIDNHKDIKSRVINNCWDIVEDYLKANPTLKSTYTKQIVLEVIKKSMPKTPEFRGNLLVKNLEVEIKQLAERETPPTIESNNFKVIKDKSL